MTDELAERKTAVCLGCSHSTAMQEFGGFHCSLRGYHASLLGAPVCVHDPSLKELFNSTDWTDSDLKVVQ